MDINEANTFLEDIIKSPKFGKGIIDPGPYNTGWVARLRNPENPIKPLFGKTIDWIRNHQLEDGSWGTEYPFSICDRIIATLMCLITLLQWNFVEDGQKIEHAKMFLSTNINQLVRLDGNIEHLMHTGFEHILPVLIDELKRMGLELGFNDVIKIFRDLRDKKLKYIESRFEDKNIPWQFSLEAFNDFVNNDQMKQMISKKTHLICLSYSSIAFALHRGVVHKKSIEMLREVVNANNGGIPTVANMAVFDTLWSIIYIYWSGYPIDNELMAPHIRWVKETSKRFGGLLAGDDDETGQGLPPDADDTANAIYVLKIANQLDSIDSIKQLMKFYRKSTKSFVVYSGQIQMSLSTNINCLNALTHFQHIEYIKEICENLSNWLKSVIKTEDNNYKIDDKWHYSSLYSLTRALFCFEFIDSNESENIYRFLLTKQNSDGGWGVCGKSTPIETGIVVIAVCYWLRKYHKGFDSKGLLALDLSQSYLDLNNEINDFWMEKVLYSLINTDKIILAAAKYSLSKLKNVNLDKDSGFFNKFVQSKT